MAYIYQVSRILLQEKISKFGHYVKGRTLDAGSGSYSRYGHLLSSDTIVRMDVASGSNVDVVGRAESTPFKDNEFDSVLSTQVFEHLEYPEKAAAETCRILKPGGYLLLTVPQWNELHEEPCDYWRYTFFGVTTLFERNGFSIVEHAQCGGFFSNLAQMGMRYLIDKFDLHNVWWGRAASPIFKVWGKSSIWLDKIDKSKANRKHTLGWVFVLKKTAL